MKDRVLGDGSVSIFTFLYVEMTTNISCPQNVFEFGSKNPTGSQPSLFPLPRFTFCVCWQMASIEIASAASQICVPSASPSSRLALPKCRLKTWTSATCQSWRNGRAFRPVPEPSVGFVSQRLGARQFRRPSLRGWEGSPGGGCELGLQELARQAGKRGTGRRGSQDTPLCVSAVEEQSSSLP